MNQRTFRGLGLLGLVAALAWLAWPTSPSAGLAQPPQAVRPQAPASSPAEAGQAGAFWALAARATAQADEATGARLSLDWDASEAGRQESAAWCARGQAAMAQFNAASVQGASAPALQEPDLSERELQAARERALRRWAAHLRGQSSARAQAAGDFLLAGQGDAGPAAKQRLLAAARGASDPMVIALALQRCGEAVECSRGLGQRWAQLEPANFQAWLHAAADLQIDLVLNGAAQATGSRAYQRELIQLLLDSPQAPTPGLRDSAEVMLLTDIEAAWGLPPWQAVINQCRQAELGPVQRRQCLAIAEAVWRSDDEALINRVLGVRLAVSQGAERDPTWRARATQAEAALQWLESDLGGRIGRAIDLTLCDRAASLALRDESRQGEAARVADAMRRADADLEALAVKRRSKAKRSLLIPMPPLPAASR